MDEITSRPNRWVIAALNDNGQQHYYSILDARFTRELSNATKFKLQEDAVGFREGCAIQGTILPCLKEDTEISKSTDIQIEKESYVEVGEEKYLAANNIIGAHFFYSVEGASYNSWPGGGTPFPSERHAQICLDRCMEGNGDVIKLSEAVDGMLSWEKLVQDIKDEESQP
jgi:hypothetical protein